ncbi:hypothetical protein CsSME_00041750 [Camellia sinensis var. sinensis]
MLFLLLVGREVRRTNSPWTHSCERKRQDAASKNMANELGTKIVNRSSVTPKLNRTRLNFRSNIAGIVKLVYMLNLRDEHLVHLKKTPFWLMFEAILINQLDHAEFRKGDDLVVNIIRAYNARDGTFRVGG